MSVIRNCFIQQGLVALSLVLALPALGQDFDLIVRHGIIIDGTGAPAFAGDCHQGRPCRRSGEIRRDWHSGS